MSTERLEYLRGELRAERISLGELIELQGLAGEIDPGDVELLEAAGVPEFPEEDEDHRYWVLDVATESNRLAAVSAAAGYTVNAIVDDEAGCVIAYADDETALRIVVALRIVAALEHRAESSSDADVLPEGLHWDGRSAICDAQGYPWLQIGFGLPADPEVWRQTIIERICVGLGIKVDS